MSLVIRNIEQLFQQLNLNSTDLIMFRRPSALGPTKDYAITVGDFFAEIGNIETTVDIIEKTSDHTLELSDQGKILELNKATAFTLTIPNDSQVNFPIESVIILTWLGVGQPTIVGNVGVVIKSEDSFVKIAKRYVSACLIKRAANDWYLIGRLSA